MQALFSGGPDIAGWTSRGLMHWFIDQNWMNLLDDFKDISGGHLYKLRSQIYDWLREEKSVDGFPVKIRGSDADKEHKINSLRSMAYALLQQYPIEPDDKVPAARQQQKAEISGKKMEHLTRWKRTVNVLQACHKDASLWYSRRATGLTVFVVALNAIISSAMFSSIQESDDENSYQTTVRVIAACLSITSGIAAAVRSALRLETISEQHSSAARRFGKLYVRFNDICDMLEIEYNPGGGEKASEWKDWFKDYMDVMEQAPMIDDNEYDKMCGKISKTSAAAVKMSSVMPSPKAANAQAMQVSSSLVEIVPS